MFAQELGFSHTSVEGMGRCKRTMAPGTPYSERTMSHSKIGVGFQLIRLNWNPTPIYGLLREIEQKHMPTLSHQASAAMKNESTAALFDALPAHLRQVGARDLEELEAKLR